MLQYDPCKANSKLIKNSFSLLKFSVYPIFTKLEHWILCWASRNQTKSSLPISLKQL